MDKYTTIIVVSKNEKQELQICVDSIRKFCDVDNYQLVIIDNASDDGTREWLSLQSDISYATVDNESTGYAEVINTAINLFSIEGDILLIHPHYAITPGCISRLHEGLYLKANIGAVGSICYEAGNDNNENHAGTYQEVVSLAEVSNRMATKQIIGLNEGIVLVRGEAVRRIGKLDEQFTSPTGTMKDFIIRLIDADFSMLCITNAIVYNMLPKSKINQQIDDMVNDEKKLRVKWGMDYDVAFNPYLLRMMIHSSECKINVLQIGCKCGATLLEIKNRYPNSTIYGYEVNEQAAQIASHFAYVEVGDLEKLNFTYNKEQFDYIILDDVIEYIRNPKEIITYCYDYLKPDGCIIACISNAMHIAVIRDLLAGNFTYTKMGICGTTRLHMFTYNDILSMFTECSYEVEEVSTSENCTINDDKEYIEALLKLEPRAKKFMFESSQYMIRAKKKQGKIIIITGENAILKYTSDQIKSAYKRQGYIVYEMSTGQIIGDPDKFLEILQSNIEKAFVFNNRGWLLKIGKENIWDLYKIPCINYILDHPFYYFDTLDCAPQNGIVACVDRKHTEYIGRFNKNINKSIFLPLAGEDISNGKRKRIADRKTDVLFVGNYKYREEYSDLSELQQLVIEELHRHPYKTVEQGIEEKYRLLHPDADDSIVKRVIEDNRIIDMYLKNYYRGDAVRRLVYAGVNVSVCGAGWQEADFYENPHLIYQGAVTQKECLEKMLDSKIVLNVMPWFKNGIHDRVINSMLAGAVCVTDNSQYLEEQFTKGSDYVDFCLENMNELPIIIDELLKNVDIMQNIADCTYEKAYEFHSWNSRIEDIIKMEREGL